MNVTFIIGNGFDINMNMHTKYEHFYQYLCRHRDEYSDNMIFPYIMSALEQKEQSGDLGTWCDYEYQLGKLLSLVSPCDKDKYIHSKLRLDDALADYLMSENQRISVRDSSQLGSQAYDKLSHFYKEMNHQYRDEYAAYSEDVHFGFINMNYTNVLDQIVSAICEDPSKRNCVSMPFHVHGDLLDGFVVGVDNINQLDNEKLQEDELLHNAMIKRTMNAALGSRRTETGKDMIMHSRYVCAYGASLGKTDRFWRQTIVEWLKKDERNRFVFYKYEKKQHIGAGSRAYWVNTVIHEFLSDMWLTGDEKDQLKEQIIVIFNAKVFDLKSYFEYGEKEE